MLVCAVLDILLVVIGIAGLAYGGDLLVGNASRLARGFGISPLVVGLTVVAFGTSAPELAASLAAALRGSPEIALANVIGSNIANVGLILGASALMWPLATTWSFVRREVAVMIAASLVAALLLLDGSLGRLEAGVLLLGLVAFLVIAFRGDSGPANAVARELGAPLPARLRPALLALAGVALLALAAQALVTGAISLAQAWGVSERVIGLTMVAIGTSLPELASSIAAALRRQGDIILGNIVGSNVFNLLSVLALAGLVHPLQVEATALRVDLLVMLLFAAVVAPIAITGWRVGRREGAALLAAYLVYVALVLV
ncbi:MAG: sodium:calcium antiporter [Trueperaceae bacterium]|nr:MAG: sodium:calcium antiporter [Trueperaceae bacterium]